MDNIIQIRRILHQHPELGYAEHWTSQFIAQRLQALGFEVTTNIAKTGVVGLLKGANRELGAIAYRADMDALPICEQTDVPFKSTNGCMHACGHDSHMAVALDVAAKVAQKNENGNPSARDIIFLFQPNEEGAPGDIPSGADLMCQEHVLENFHIQKIIALHSDPTLDSGLMGICQGPIWAESGRFTAHIQGEAAHAAYPEKGKDALWAATEAVSAIYAALKRMRPVLPEVVSICTLNAGKTFNVIADEATFEGIIRATSRKHLDDIFAILQNVTENVARACQTTAKLNLFYGASAVRNDDSLVEIARSIWTKLHCAKEVKMNMAAEDFAYFSNHIPSFYAMMGVKPKGMTIPPSHSDKFTLDEAALPIASNAMFELLMHLANQT